jgi:hypothetical protein
LRREIGDLIEVKIRTSPTNSRESSSVSSSRKVSEPSVQGKKQGDKKSKSSVASKAKK